MESTDLIDAMGGTCKVAALCGITTGAVSQWRQKGIPKARLLYFSVLRPELFGCELTPSVNGVEKEEAA
jgi:hypothetical protein